MNYSSTLNSYRDTKQFSELVCKYQEQDTSIKPYITAFSNVDSFKNQIELKKNIAVNRNILVTELKNQYALIDDNSEVFQQIESLKNNNTFTVTTGHQCCLFTGPLYFIFKIISTINLAKKLNQEIPESHIVPVFWMATEDHDFAEINSIQLQNNKVTFQSDELGNAVGRIRLNEIENTIAEIEPLIQHFEFGKTALELLRKAYNSNETIASATRIFVHELFKNDGLVIIDADSALFKREFISILKNEILTEANFETVIQTTNQLIKDELLEKSQITPRSINLFLLDENKRQRIDRNEFGFSLKESGKNFSDVELLSLLESHPEKFSPNVVLRPLYQERILPNLAYIGGGAEVTYWLQLRNVFSSNNIVFPILMLRNSALIMEKMNLDKFLSMGFSADAIFDETSTLQKDFLKRNTTEQSFENEIQAIQQLFSELKLNAIEIDKTLGSTVDAESAKAIASIKNIEQKILRAQKRNEETSMNQVEKFKQKYFPNGGLQERNDNFLYFFSKYGFDFLDMLKSELNPLNNQFVTTIIE